MRKVPQSITDIWLGGEYTGDRKPMARVTLQRMHINLQKVDSTRLFASAVFGQADIPREMPNIKSVEWDRSVGSDVATCTVIFYNTTPLPLGDQPVPSGDFDLPGSYTYNYGVESWARARWGTAVNFSWQGYLVPDRLLRTYEGYGFDASKCPEKDPNLVQTGMWLIDSVEYDVAGLITVTCRDIGRLLLDHIVFPPVIPLANYPLMWDPYHSVTDPVATVVTGGKTYRPTYLTDSGVPYNGKNGPVHGHRPSHAFDTHDSTYWLSVGNSLPDAGYSYEYVEGSCAGKTLSTVKVRVYGGPYRIYLSVKIKGKWSGTKQIPYDPHNPISAPNGANITYSIVDTVAKEGTQVFTLNHPVVGVEAIRITLTGLFNSGIGPYKYRGGIRTITCSESTSKSSHTSSHTVGSYGDYSEVVKYILACGGFHWPNSALDYITDSDGTRSTSRPSVNDPFLKSGRIWGDIELSGTNSGVDAETGISNPLQADQFDKRPLMDVIAYIRDGLGFIFYIDETGGAVFRMPNIFSVGNWVGDVASTAGYASNAVITIDERQTLLGLRATLSSKNIREYVFIADANGQFGATAAGFNPIKPNPGFRRVGGWTDQNWKDVIEAQKMADMITVQQAFSYRTDTLTIVANPAIQIDDQVQLYERISGEGFAHYVKGIKSTNDLETGKWTYDLSTNWLGEAPVGTWAFSTADLSDVTREFLEAVLAARQPAREILIIGGGAMNMTVVKH